MSSHKTEHVKVSRRFKAQVLAALIHLGWTQGDLARRVGRSRARVNEALNRGKFPRVQQAIRDALKLN